MLNVRLIFVLFSAVVYLISVVCAVDEQFKIVNTENGAIRGQLKQSFINQKSYYSFRGIPYAQAPINELRFKAPRTSNPWSEIRDALVFGSECVQKSLSNEKTFGAEDCLFLNVYVPANLNKTLSVMIFIHGGGFTYGSSNDFGPDFLLDNDVILVTFNYRLGPFGFLSLDLPEYSGNMGLKDQLAAIKWVNRNIKYFGGDSNKITIFGQSAGSTSAEYHTLSPASEGLFQRAILQSGSVLNTWGVTKSHLKIVQKFGRKFGNDMKDTDDVIKFLKLVDTYLLAETFINNWLSINLSECTAIFVWTPVIEVPNAIEPFLLSDPKDLFKTEPIHKIDILAGYNSAELYMITVESYVNLTLLESFNKALNMLMPWADWTHTFESLEYELAIKEIRNFYIPGGTINLNTFYEYNQMLSDSWLSHGAQTSIYYQAKRPARKVYQYIFDLDTKLNVFKSRMGQVELNLPGASHSDELPYLFFYTFDKELYKNLSEDSFEMKGVRLMTKLWTNFAKFGTPTLPGEEINLLPVLKDEKNFVKIINNGLVKGVNPADKIITFWNYLYKKYILKNFSVHEVIGKKEKIINNEKVEL